MASNTHDPATVERVAEAVFDAAAYSYESPADWIDQCRITCWDDSQIDENGVCDTELAIEELYGEPAQWRFADDVTRRSGRRIAKAALDALTELGWRPPLTEDEQQDLRRVLDRAIDSGSKSGQDMTATLWLARMRRIRDMLTGGRHE